VLATRAPAQHGMPDVAQLIQYGASPRASLGIVRATRALALLRGRDYALPQDVQDIAPDILRHRLVLSYDALADDIPADHVVARIMQMVPPPQVSSRQGSPNGQPQPGQHQPGQHQPGQPPQPGQHGPFGPVGQSGQPVPALPGPLTPVAAGPPPATQFIAGPQGAGSPGPGGVQPTSGVPAAVYESRPPQPGNGSWPGPS
jgi:MoxR-like ATPase